MLENERPLLVAVALDARSIGADRKLCLFLFEAPVRGVTIAAVHRSLEHLMVERLAELGLCFGMA